MRLATMKNGHVADARNKKAMQRLTSSVASLLQASVLLVAARLPLREWDRWLIVGSNSVVRIIRIGTIAPVISIVPTIVVALRLPNLDGLAVPQFDSSSDDYTVVHHQGDWIWHVEQILTAQIGVGLVGPHFHEGCQTVRLRRSR